MPLTPLQENFVEEFCATFQKRDSAVRAGYSKSGAAVRANELLKNSEVVSEIRRRIELSFVGLVVEARDSLAEIMRSGGKDDAVRLKATESVLNRAGLLVRTMSEHHVTVEHRDGAPVSAILLRAIQKAVERGALVIPDQSRLLDWLGELDSPLPGPMIDVTPVLIEQDDWTAP